MEDRITKSFAVEAGGHLTLESDLGSIDVKSSDAPSIEVHIIRKMRDLDQDEIDDLLNHMEIETDQNEQEALVRVRLHKKRTGWWDPADRHLKLHFDVTVPRTCDLTLRTGGGGISVTDLTGAIDCKTSGGGIHLGEIQGTVHARTSGGNIAIDGCTGPVDVQTSGGNIQAGPVEGEVRLSTSGGSISLKRATGRSLVQTSGGSITIEEALSAIEATTSGGHVTAHLTRQPQDHCRLETSGGHVTAYVAENLAFNLVARTSGGHITTEFPVTIEGKMPRTSLNAEINGGGPEMPRTSLNAEINGGGPELIMSTSGGHVSLRKLGLRTEKNGRMEGP